MASVNNKVLQVKILQRFMDEKAINSLLQEYENHSYKLKVIRAPDERDVRIANLVKKNQSISRTAKDLNVSQFRVYAALSRVTAYSK